MSHLDTASNFHSHRTLNDHGTEADNDDHFNRQYWENGHKYATAYPAYAPRTLEADTMSPSTAILPEVQNNFSGAEIIFDNVDTPIGSFNGYLDRFHSSGSMLASTATFVLPPSRLDEWNSLSPSMNLPGILELPSSGPQMNHSSTLNHITVSEYPYAGTFYSESGCNIGPSASANGGLIWMHGGCLYLFLPCQCVN